MKRDRCVSCGGTEFVDAVDNRGRPYKGCARCVIVLVPPKAAPSWCICPFGVLRGDCPEHGALVPSY